jgi:TolB-like protein/Flp pilus assembly protein TadD
VTDPPPQGQGESTWDRLRRRKVVQWGIAYAAGAWGLLQGIAYMCDTFGWAHTIQQAATILLLVGLPIALVLAWYHGDKGEQRVTRTELAILTLLFLVGGGLFWRYEYSVETVAPPSTRAPVAQAPTAAAGTDKRPSIAVLPFENRSSKQGDAFFVDGIHDDILTQLSKISGLRVISRTSVERFRNTTLSIREVADQLGVSSILEGGVQRAGDRVRINVQLIDATTDAHLWAADYDRGLTATNIFAIQSEVATAIAAALKTSLMSAERSRVNAIPTRNLDAWESYQLGNQHVAKRTSADLTAAEGFYRKAIALDSKFGLAYAGLANALGLQVFYGDAPRVETLETGESAADTALRLDPDLAEAWAAAGGIAMQQHRDDRASKALRRAIALNPNYATAYHWLSTLLWWDFGRPDQALDYAQTAAKLDPLSAIIVANLGGVLDALGNFDEAAAVYRRALALDPSLPTPTMFLGMLEAYALDRFGDAVRLLEKAKVLDLGNPEPVWSLATLQLDMGADSEAARTLANARLRWPQSRSVTALAAFVHLSQGDLDAADRDARRTPEPHVNDMNPVSLLAAVDLSRGDVRAALSRFAMAYPELLTLEPPRVDRTNVEAAIGVASLLRASHEDGQAQLLLEQSEQVIRTMPRLGTRGFGIADVRISALRGDGAKALAALRHAEQTGWRGPLWRYYRDFDPALGSIRGDPGFRAIFADIERDMARQRAELAKRRKSQALDVSASDP